MVVTRRPLTCHLPGQPLAHLGEDADEVAPGRLALGAQ